MGGTNCCQAEREGNSDLVKESEVNLQALKQSESSIELELQEGKASKSLEKLRSVERHKSNENKCSDNKDEHSEIVPKVSMASKRIKTQSSCD